MIDRVLFLCSKKLVLGYKISKYAQCKRRIFFMYTLKYIRSVRKVGKEINRRN